MRSPKTVLENLAQKAKDVSYRFERVYRNLYNPEFYWLAYQRIYAAPGNMTPGSDTKTIDGMSEMRINRIIRSLKDHTYQPVPARRTYIEKKNSTKKRPLGIPSADDKLVQEIIRMILESIYETNFSNNSHGFRPNRSCHTALSHIQNRFTGINWFVEGDIKACFDSFDHHILINILRKRFADEAFIELMWKFLRAGYMEQWTLHLTYSGTPQGSGMSPILANIYLHELDTFVEQYAESYAVGTCERKRTPEYAQISSRLQRIRNKHRAHWDQLDKAARKAVLRTCKELTKKLRSMPYRQQGNTAYKRMQYCRYADDFVIGVIGSKADAERIKRDLKVYLADQLKLTLSEEKTKITHAKDAARFLGYDITRCYDNSVKRGKNGRVQRANSGTIKLYVPREKWEQKLQDYKAMRITHNEDGSEKWQPLHRGKLSNWEDIRIIRQYNAEIRGLYNYYAIANNASVIGKFAYIMEYSMYKTFALKYRTTMGHIIDKYSDNKLFRVPYQTKAGLRYCDFYHEGFGRKKKPDSKLFDVLPQYRIIDRPTTLAYRLRFGICELCGGKTTDAQMHHVRKLADLSDSTDWERLMKQKRRKTLAVCPKCHDYIHGA